MILLLILISLLKSENQIIAENVCYDEYPVTCADHVKQGHCHGGPHPHMSTSLALAAAVDCR